MKLFEYLLVFILVVIIVVLLLFLLYFSPVIKALLAVAGVVSFVGAVVTVGLLTK